MELKRKNLNKREKCVRYYGEGSPYTPYTSAYNAGGAVQINIADIFPATGMEGVYAKWGEAWSAWKTEITEQFNAMSDMLHKAYKSAKNWFKSFFGA